MGYTITESSVYVLLVTRHDNANAATGNIAEPNVESTEVVSNNEEHPKRLPWVLHFGQEVGGEAE